MAPTLNAGLNRQHGDDPAALVRTGVEQGQRRRADQRLALAEVDDGGGLLLALGVADQLGLAGLRVESGHAALGGAEVDAEGGGQTVHLEILR